MKNTNKKTRKRRSKIFFIDKMELQEIVDKSSSFKEVLSKLNLGCVGGNHKTLKIRIREDNISTLKLEKNRKVEKSKRRKFDKLDNSEIFIKDSNCYIGASRRRIIRDSLIDYKCSECGNNGTHNGKSLTLQLDHINGINNDNRLENLRFLCPNCHSQTDTFGSKNININKKKWYCKCGNEVSSKGNRCVKCFRESRRKIKNRPSIEILKKDVENGGYSATGRKYGVSDNCIRKWLRH